MSEESAVVTKNCQRPTPPSGGTSEHVTVVFIVMSLVMAEVVSVTTSWWNDEDKVDEALKNKKLIPVDISYDRS